MKISVRVYQETNQFSVDAEPSTTIGELKEKIHAAQGYEIAKQTILYCARTPPDDMTLEESRISDRGFIMVLMTKPRPPPPEPRPVSPSSFKPPRPGEEYVSAEELEEFKRDMEALLPLDFE